MACVCLNLMLNAALCFAPDLCWLMHNLKRLCLEPHWLLKLPQYAHVHLSHMNTDCYTNMIIQRAKNRCSPYPAGCDMHVYNVHDILTQLPYQLPRLEHLVCKHCLFSYLA